VNTDADLARVTSPNPKDNAQSSHPKILCLDEDELIGMAFSALFQYDIPQKCTKCKYFFSFYTFFQLVAKATVKPHLKSWGFTEPSLFDNINMLLFY